MRFTRQDHDRLIGIIEEAARREILPRFRNLGGADIREKKSAIDLVTEADEQAERFVFRELAKAWPGALLVGEESASADPSVLKALPEADLAFILDPVDGTLNFASDMPLFVVMAAVMVKGEVVAAVIHDPIVQDHMLARRGEGAWLQRADGRHRDLKVIPGAPVDRMTGMVSARYFQTPHDARLPGLFPRFADISTLRCCGHEYRLMAAGHLHFTMYGSLNPWDHAPGSLIVAEAGGHVRFLDGTPYRAGHQPLGLLSAPDAESWDAIRAAFFGA